MIGRRDVLIGAGCVAATAAGFALKPRKVTSLLGARDLGGLVPESFGRWKSRDVSDPLALNPDTLSGKLYNQLVTRIYSADGENEVFMLLAHGQQQTEELQLHRPEICYPAFGYSLLRNEPENVAVRQSVMIPSRRLLAQAEGRQEAVIYWTRIGEYLPASASEQREARVRNALAGIVPDGVLCRFSATAFDAISTWNDIARFIGELLTDMPAATRSVLIGTQRAKAIG